MCKIVQFKEKNQAPAGWEDESSMLDRNQIY